MGGSELGYGSYNLNALGYVDIRNIGTFASPSPYALDATYAGDNSFNGSSAGESITISQSAHHLGHRSNHRSDYPWPAG